MSLRNPLARVKGLGPSGEGSHHWWLQRVTALALIPLTIWFLFSFANHVGDDYQTVLNWIGQPYVALLLLLYLSFMFFHGQLGMQVVIEDYVHHEGIKLICLLLTKVVLLVSGLGALFAVLRIAL